MSDFHNKRAAKIIKQILYVTIATVDADGQPWNTPVYSGFDEDLSFYWFSDKNSQHSRNIRNNPAVFLVIYDSTAPEGTGEGVYIKAKASELNEEDAALAALKIMDSRVGKAKDRKFGSFSGEAPLRVFRAIPSSVWMNADDEDQSGNYIRDIRVVVPIDELKKLIKA